MGTDCAFLLEQQYRTAENLQARIAVHERFSTNPQPFPRWGRALPEVARVLRPGGVVIATTNGSDHLRELGAAWSEQWSRSFGLENGPAQLGRFFVEVPP